MECEELLQGQKLLGWMLILVGLLVLMLVGLAQALVTRFSLPSLECFASWAPGAWWNRTCVGIVAWLLLAGGYVFLVSACLQDHLHRMEGQMAACSTVGHRAHRSRHRGGAERARGTAVGRACKILVGALEDTRSSGCRTITRGPTSPCVES